ncbi:inositol monophosphatase [Nonomuraea phyllanthi]|uniref:Inositol-1-monophosphatase n=1 Tax=Nonomuraea phyllanthi TaxID=2219224 RepID=A0A5C4WNJ6_9ACTN|nr:inositol monophosphatase family protein [Nonomuraea phyllanthi]KAB8195260.1 inositol monophosphatase [Nonomuraea phyllanthi]QFY10609.1 inositol monophosphatase [Nonomuraea phyllanthi]
MDVTHLLDIATEAARATGPRLREAFRSRPGVTTKHDFHDPVTQHDRAAEETIRAVITARRPESAIVGEEGGTTGSGDLVWYVDPIDGTANFAAGMPFFCVSIAAAVRGELVAGVIYDPVREDEFSASGDGAWCNGTPLRSVGASGDREAMLLSSYPTAMDVEADGDAALRRYGRFLTSFSAVRRPGSAALKLAYVAAGWADAAYGTQANPWDVAAGALLVRRAGGVYLGDPLAKGDYLAHVRGFDLNGSALAEVAPH